jgi:hypothetical protein
MDELQRLSSIRQKMSETQRNVDNCLGNRIVHIVGTVLVRIRHKIIVKDQL